MNTLTFSNDLYVEFTKAYPVIRSKLITPNLWPSRIIPTFGLVCFVAVMIDGPDENREMKKYRRITGKPENF